MISRPLILLTLLALTILSGCKPVVNFFAFHPNRSEPAAAEVAEAGAKEVFFQSQDGLRIQALHFDNPKAKKILIYFHGNGGNLYHRLGDYQRLRDFGVSVLGVSYRGYGKSEGSSSEAGIYLDGRAAYTYTTEKLNYAPENIVLMGRSLGSTVAVDLARDKPLAGVLLVTPLSTGRDQADAMGLGFARMLSGDSFDNVTKISRLKAPLLIIHGTRDRIVPYTSGRKLFDAAPGTKKFIKIDNADHNNLSHQFADTYWGAVAEFLKRL